MPLRGRPPSLPLALRSKLASHRNTSLAHANVSQSYLAFLTASAPPSCTARLATTSSLPGSISVPSTVTLTSHGGSHTVGLYVPDPHLRLRLRLRLRLLAWTALMHFARSHLQGHRGPQRGARIRASPRLHTVSPSSTCPRANALTESSGPRATYVASATRLTAGILPGRRPNSKTPIHTPPMDAADRLIKGFGHRRLDRRPCLDRPRCQRLSARLLPAGHIHHHMAIAIEG